MYILSHGLHTAIFIIPMFMLLLKDLLAKFIISYTFKDQRATSLCLVEGNLASLHYFVSFQIEHMKYSRMRRVTKENTIYGPSLKHIQILALLQNIAFVAKYMEMTHLGSATVHHLIACLFLECPAKNPVRHVARGIDRVSPEPPRSPMPVEHCPGHLTQGSVFSIPYAILGGIYNSKSGVQDPGHGRRFRNESF
jgi:hypothetical protein